MKFWRETPGDTVAKPQAASVPGLKRREHTPPFLVAMGPVSVAPPGRAAVLLPVWDGAALTDPAAPELSSKEV